MCDSTNTLPGECVQCAWCHDVIEGEVALCLGQTMHPECVDDFNTDFYQEEPWYDDDGHEDGYEDEVDEYTEWQDLYGGDDWDQGQFDYGEW